MSERVLTKKDITKSRFRWFITLELPNSFERLQAVSFTYTISAALQKLYKDDKEGLKDALKRHLEFFNTEGTIGSLIVGVVLALEEKKKLEGDVDPEVITNLKLGLMGPIAGIGDSLIQGTIKSIILSLAASFGLQGNIIGGLLPFLFPLTVYFVGRYLAILGYNLGTEAVNKLIGSGLMTNIINVASILGIFMMGALSGSYVKLSTPLEFTIGSSGKSIAVQEVLDSLLPGLLPLLCIFGIVWYFKNKKQNYLLLVISIMIIGMLGSLVGIF
ncbi:MAG: PTS system mannose/fructose/sorbose family transporter subunit IID [Erysipelotrichaceae bacterium]|jgi:D-glucosaminate-specific PTS system IID component|nr:PTS system mannose/fructose/sorbose family transporter subunit IID [Erysipelotrichaceae bacterium]